MKSRIFKSNTFDEKGSFAVIQFFFYKGISQDSSKISKIFDLTFDPYLKKLGSRTWKD